MSGSSIDVIVDDTAVSNYLKKLEEKIGKLHIPLADIGESLLLSHEDRWDKQVSPDGQKRGCHFHPPTRKLSHRIKIRFLFCTAPLKTCTIKQVAIPLNWGLMT
jgi:hypothetical protein